MEKKKIIVLALSVILIMSMYMTYRTYENKPKELPEEKEKIETKRKQFAMFIKEGDKYVEYHGENGNKDLFPEGYKLNEEQSRCEDIDGNKIEDISFDTNTNSITITSNKTAYCYLYFDKVPQTLQALQSQADSGLSTDLVGGMYRYQGSSVNNYICLKQIGTGGCSDKSNEMYRIIGITPEGNIKVMKQTKYGNTYVWDSEYSTKFIYEKQSSFCGTYTCPEWPSSEIYTTLNGSSNSFLSTLNSEIQNKIADWEWWYGDIGYDYAKDLTEDNLYQIETGQTHSQYYSKTRTDLDIQTGKWQKMDSKFKIGLIYLHDYYYQSTTSDNCHYKNGKYSECKDGGWMHISKNGGTTSDDEWTMSRIGRDSATGDGFDAWSIRPGGYSYYNYLGFPMAIRPVFYLMSDVKLDGAGTTTKPFYIVS